MENPQEKAKQPKTFKFEEVEYTILPQSAKASAEARFAYSIAFTKALKAGLLIRKHLELELKKVSDQIFTDYSNRKAELITNMGQTEATLKASNNPEEIELLAQMLILYRAQLFEEDRQMNELFANTADQVAEEDRILHLVAALIADSNKKRLWNSVDELLADTRSNFIELCKYYITCLEYNLDPDWQKKLPEMEAQSRLEEIRLKEKEAAEVAVAAETEAVVETVESAPIVESKPKRGRSKKKL